MEPRPVVRIYFFRRDDCDFCHEAEPPLQALRTKYPTRILVIPLNTDRKPDWEVKGWAPTRNGDLVTPAYAMVIGDELAKTHVGGLGLKELERFVGKENL